MSKANETIDSLTKRFQDKLKESNAQLRSLNIKDFCSKLVQGIFPTHTNYPYPNSGFQTNDSIHSMCLNKTETHVHPERFKKYEQLQKKILLITETPPSLIFLVEIGIRFAVKLLSFFSSSKTVFEFILSTLIIA